MATDWLCSLVPDHGDVDDDDGDDDDDDRENDDVNTFLGSTTRYPSFV